MSIVFTDSFDHYALGTSPSTPGKWATYSDAANTEIIAGGRNGNGLRFNNGGFADVESAAISNDGGRDFIISHAFRLAGAVGTGAGATVYEGSTRHLNWRVSTGGVVQIRRDSTVLATTGVAFGAADTWYYVEFKGNIHDTTGSWEFRVNGTVIGSGSGLDTQNGGTGAWDRIRISTSQLSSSDATFDDLVVMDGTNSGVTGAPNNDFLGDTVVEALFPNGNGATSDFTGQDADSTDNYQNVDETPGPDSDTTYNESDIVNDVDTYTFDNLDAISYNDIKAVVWVGFAKKDGAGSRGIKPVLRPTSTDRLGTEISPGTSYSHHYEVFESNPDDTTQWLNAEVDALEAGQQISS